MITYIIRRILILPVIVLGVTILIFTMLSLLTPYERASLYVQDVPKRQGALEAIIEKYGLDDPIYIQYYHWMVGRKDSDTGQVQGGVLRGDLGFSQTGASSVAEVIGRRLPATAELAIWAAVPMIGIGIWMGIGRTPSRLSIASTTRSKSAPIRSSLLTNAIRGTRYRSA